MAASKLSKQMTRAVAVGKLEKYEYTTTPFTFGKGILDLANGTKARFTIFNKDKEGVANPHTKAKDFSEMYKEGDLVYITGQDNRSYSEAKDTYYEDIQVWDFRDASEDEIKKWVFVYVADVKSLTDTEMVVGVLDYKDNEMLYHLDITKANKVAGLEVGDRVKVKGTIYNGRVEDFYGEGEYKTIRNVVEIKLENNKAEIEAENGGSTESGQKSENDLW